MSQACRLAPLAQQDVEDLFDYIAADDFETALRVEQVWAGLDRTDQ